MVNPTVSFAEGKLRKERRKGTVEEIDDMPMQVQTVQTFPAQTSLSHDALAPSDIPSPTSAVTMSGGNFRAFALVALSLPSYLYDRYQTAGSYDYDELILEALSPLIGEISQENLFAKKESFFSSRNLSKMPSNPSGPG